MTHQSDCTLKPDAEPIINEFAQCVYHGTIEVSEGNIMVHLTEGVTNGEVRDMLTSVGAKVVSEYGDRVITIDGTDLPNSEYSGLDEHPIVLDTSRSIPMRLAQDSKLDSEAMCESLIEDTGLTWQGSGAGRATYSVVPDPDYPGQMDSEVTPFTECVVKFARGSTGFAGGQEQMSDEIDQWNDLPVALRGDVRGRGPIFNPLQDYDEDERLWLTQPWCPPPGNPNEVIDRLSQLGWEIADIRGRRDNVGTYPDHGGNAIIDYGLELKQQAITLNAEFETIIDQLQDLGVSDGTQSVDQDGGEMEFRANALPGDVPPKGDSQVRLDRDGMVRYVKLAMPGRRFTGGGRLDLRDIIERNLPDPVARGVRYDARVDDSDDGIMYPNVVIEIPRGDPLPPEMAAEEIANVWEAYEEAFAMLASTDPAEEMGMSALVAQLRTASVRSDIDAPEESWEAALETLMFHTVTFPDDGFGGNEPDAKFTAPLFNEPDATSRASVIHWVTPAEVESVSYYAAEFTATPDTRADGRTQALNIATEVSRQYRFCNVRGTLTHDRFLDGETDRQVYTVLYNIDHVGGLMSPDEVLTVLQTLTETHNNTFDPSAVTRV